MKKSQIVIVIVSILILILLIIGIIYVKPNIENIENNTTNNEEYTLKKSTSETVDLFWNEEDYKISIEDGNIKVEDKTYTIPNEKIKYFFMQRYQYSNTTVFHYLTESGNVYVNEITSMDDKIDALNKFTKLDVSNVSEIIVLPNDHYGKTWDDESGIIDNRKEYIYAVTNGENVKLEYQYAY